MTRGQGLEHFLDEATPIPAKFVTASGGDRSVNPAYLRYVKQDCPLALWLLSNISPSFLPQMVGVETSTSIWSSISKLSTTKQVESCSLWMELNLSSLMLRQGFLIL